MRGFHLAVAGFWDSRIIQTASHRIQERERQYDTISVVAPFPVWPASIIESYDDRDSERSLRQPQWIAQNATN